jgi:hypothetical protein
MDAAFFPKEGVWYASTRLEKEGHVDCKDFDCTTFFDAWLIKKTVPVFSTKSPVFQALLIYVYFNDLPANEQR